MKTSKLVIRILSSCFVLFVHLTSAQNIDQTSILALEKVIQNDLKLSKAPGALVAFARGGEFVYQKPFGFRDKRKKELVTEQTLFLTASLTKTFTTVALLTLCEEKGIEMQAPIGSILDYLSPKLGALTVHEILSMSSGIIDYLPTRKKDRENARAYFERYGDRLVAEKLQPVFSYTNIGHVLAGELIVELSGMPFLEAIQKMIFDPLHMENSTFLESEAQLKGYSLAYEKGSKVSHKLVYPFIRSAASMFSNIKDLLLFADCFMNHGKVKDQQIISENVIKKMATSYTPIGVLRQYLGFPDSAYNYGLVGFNLQGIHFLGHPGETGSQNTIFVMAPKYKAAFILMSNAGAYPFIDSFEKMLMTFLPVKMDTEKDEVNSDLNALVGKYYRPNILGNESDRIAIRIIHEKLYIDLGEENRYPLTPNGKNRFTYESPTIAWPMEIRFYKDSNGAVEYMNHAWRTFIKMQ